MNQSFWKFYWVKFEYLKLDSHTLTRKTYRHLCSCRNSWNVLLLTQSREQINTSEIFSTLCNLFPIKLLCEATCRDRQIESKQVTHKKDIWFKTTSTTLPRCNHCFIYSETSLFKFNTSFERLTHIKVPVQFSGILPRFSPNQNFWGCPCTSCTLASYTTAWRCECLRHIRLDSRLLPSWLVVIRSKSKKAWLDFYVFMNGWACCH